jgi:hypothetical protein
MNTADIDTTNMCSHLRHKLMDNDGIYHHLWQQINDDPNLTAVVRYSQPLSGCAIPTRFWLSTNICTGDLPPSEKHTEC